MQWCNNSPTDEGYIRKEALLFIVFLLLVLAVIGYGPYWVKSLAKEHQKEQGVELTGLPEPDRIAIEGDTSQLAGSLFMTLVSKDSEIPRPHGYVYNFDTQEFIKGDESGHQLTIFHTISTDGSQMAFLGGTRAMFEVANDHLPQAMQVFSVPRPFTSELPNITYNTFPITDVELDAKQTLTVSGDGRVLYAAYPVGTSRENISPNTWNIYLATPEGKHDEIVKGSHPIWIDGHRFLYLRDEGIFVFDLATGNSAPVWLSRATARHNMKLSLSPEKDTVIWTVPDRAEVYVLALDKETWNATLKGVLPIKGFWSAFSPGGNVVAIQIADENNDNARIVFYETETLTPHNVEIDLGDFVQTRMFLTGWH